MIYLYLHLVAHVVLPLVRVLPVYCYRADLKLKMNVAK